jgi:hypothetical protein
MSLPKYLSNYHNVHWVEFYKHSVFSAPVFMPMNCFTFDALSCLSDDDMNLFFVMGCCFICHVTTHRTEVCPHRGHHLLFCKRLLGQPHREWFELIWWSPGLDAMMAREAEWKVREVQRDDMIGWGEDRHPSSSLEGWPGCLRMMIVERNGRHRRTR